MKKIRLFILMIVCFFFSVSGVDANKIKSIDMSIYLDSSGNASVVEEWNVYLKEGTEGYRAFGEISKDDISNFTVTDEDGVEYKNLSDWDSSASFELKSYRSGIVNTFDGIELCWGISKYGNRKYTLRYDINNFVTQYTDKQGIYFNLLDMDQVVGDVNIKIYSDVSFSLDNTKIWSFGNDGDIKFKDGSIIIDSSGKLKKNQYMVLLARFENDIFNIEEVSNQSFDEVYDMAMSDISIIDRYEDVKEENNFSFIDFKLILLFLFIVILMIIVANRNGKKILFQRQNHYDLYFGVNGKKLPKNSDIPYFRDIPCNKDICYAYWVCYHYNIVPLDNLREGLLGAMLLKWIKDGSITVVDTKKKILNLKDNNYAINFSNLKTVSNSVENELFQMFKSASSDGKVLGANEFGNWCMNNYEQVETWFYNVICYTNFELEKNGLISNRDVTTNNLYSSNQKKIMKNVDVKVKDEAIKLKGLKKYLLAFSLMNEKPFIEVHLWNEYLMFARLLGIADKVEEQFSKLYPQFEEVSLISNVFVNSLVKNIAHSGYDSYRRSRNVVSHSSYGRTSSGYNYSGTSRISGGGGRSYRSGGSSSRGSRGGGFR